MLPKLTYKTLELTVPSTKKTLISRPLLAKDEKVLRNSLLNPNSYKMILKTIRDILDDCLENNSSLEGISIFDLESLYVQNYSKSSSILPKSSFRDGEDDKIRTFDIDLSKVTVKFPDEDLRNVQISDTIQLVLKYPDLSILDYNDTDLTEIQTVEKLLLSSIDKVVEGDNIYDLKLESPDDIKTWIDTIPKDSYSQISDFFRDIPTIIYEIKYINDSSNERTITLRSLNDIFNWI